MKEKLKSGDEIDCVWARHILKTFQRPGVAKKTKRRIHKRRRQENKLKLKDEIKGDTQDATNARIAG